MSSETENSVKSLLPHVAESDGSGSMHARVWLPICSLSGRDRCFGVLEVNSNARNAKSKGIEFSDAKESDLGLIVQSLRGFSSKPSKYVRGSFIL
ncbi:hypothetical protein HanIR_Chr02g0084881 [Helianthus annuus]|nr:hypothetical protein HanIR_Chr02g0084881 [Helianthus annuus]